ncbi:DNA-directed DNA polymerase [Melia azedarach]|uniref:DNA-directed DNA polymerase n=1 Tax=Melia azedarach TaxID=155640 RepID=A0ACC1WQ53_MELAZ|nr:DNA-directed DNA polymerase [Melia azedarach]
MGQMANLLAERQQGTLPSNTETNPKEQVKAITFRSGKQLGELKNKLEEATEEQVEFCPSNVTSTIDKDNDKVSENANKTFTGASSSIPQAERASLNKNYVPPIPFPQRLRKNKLDKQFSKFIDVFKKLHINIPFADALEQMPSYVKFMKEILSNKRKLEENETVMLTEECSAILQNKLPPKLKDPGSFTIPCTIGEYYFEKALCDLGASINLMHFSIFRKLGLGEAKATTVSLQLADRSIKHPRGVIEDVLVKVDKFIFPADFIVLDMEADREIPLILGRPFLATGRTLIDVQQGKLILRVQDEQIVFNVFKAIKYPSETDCCFQIDALDKMVAETFKHGHPNEPLEVCIVHAESTKSENAEIVEYAHYLGAAPPYSLRRQNFEELDRNHSQPLSSTPNLELKPLPSHLRYAYLGKNSTFPVIISASLSELEEEKLLRVLRDHKAALGWFISDIKGISPSICMHKILMEENFRPVVEHQRRLNPMKEVVRAEVLKLLNAGMIYPIFDSPWMSPVQVVPKKGGMTVVKNDNNELIPIRTVTGWRVCVDYRKLNDATRNDNFPLPFIDQMLERLAGHSHYCFLDGYSGYNQVLIAPEDQEKTTFTCPYGTFAFRRMPFGLCNAPATFQRCMTAIFFDMVERFIEVFMDDFSVFGSSFDNCLNNLALVL